jgi:predicted O-methyltransferase YrrM
MALARRYEKAVGTVVSTVHDAYADRCHKPSDICEYLPVLYETTRRYPGVRVLELGTRKGNSTLAFLAAAAEVRGHVHSVDISPAVLRDPAGMKPWAKVPWWTFTCGDDLDPSVQSLLPAQVDVLFLDTSHEYEATLAELKAYMPRVAPGGVAFFHDTKFTGWGGNPPDSTRPEVAQALDVHCRKTGLSWEEIGGGYGMGVIWL